jgi:hypothetical protein
MNSVESIVRQYIPLPSKTSPKGWYTLRCPVCNDHKYKKRGGWKFEDVKTSYHCFNCSIAATYDEEIGFLSDDMIKVLDSFGVPEDVITKLKFELFKRKKLQKTSSPTKTTFQAINTIPLPKHFYRVIQDEDDVWSQIAQEYLLTRGIDIDDYKFYLSKGGTKLENMWKHRLIIPIYKDDRLVFWQGRDLTDSKKTKYLSSESVSKGSVIYGFDHLFSNTEQPLFVVEGFFDAFHIEGVAVFGNEMSTHQISLINASPRKKVVIPDRKGDGGLLALQGIQHGWGVCVLPFDDCKDVNDAIVKYGKLFVMKTLMENVVYGFEAELRVSLLCERSKRK